MLYLPQQICTSNEQVCWVLCKWPLLNSKHKTKPTKYYVNTIHSWLNSWYQNVSTCQNFGIDSFKTSILLLRISLDLLHLKFLFRDFQALTKCKQSINPTNIKTLAVDNDHILGRSYVVKSFTKNNLFLCGIFS